MSSQLRDKFLLYQIQTKRDANAYGELYDKYVAGIFRFISFKVNSREEAQDLTSEVFLKAWHYALESRDIGSFSALLYRIARNLVIDYYRSRKTHISLNEEMESENDERQPTDQGEQIRMLDTTMEAAVVIEAMKLMKEEYRDILMLRHVEDLSISEIADIVGKSQVHVRVTIHRAAKTLKTILEKQNGTA